MLILGPGIAALKVHSHSCYTHPIEARTGALRAAHCRRSFAASHVRIRDGTSGPITVHCKVKLTRKVSYRVTRPSATRKRGVFRRGSLPGSRRNSFHSVVERYRLLTTATTTRGVHRFPGRIDGPKFVRELYESDNYRRYTTVEPRWLLLRNGFRQPYRDLARLI